DRISGARADRRSIDVQDDLRVRDDQRAARWKSGKAGRQRAGGQKFKVEGPKVGIDDSSLLPSTLEFLPSAFLPSCLASIVPPAPGTPEESSNRSSTRPARRRDTCSTTGRSD